MEAPNDRIASIFEEFVNVIFPSRHTLALGDDEQTTEQVCSTYAAGNLQKPGVWPLENP